MLLRLLRGEAEGKRELAIAAAASLASYPDSESKQALLEALHSPNWYIRQNAAYSLKTLGVTWEEAKASSGGDLYATEMLENILGGASAAEQANEREVLSVV